MDSFKKLRVPGMACTGCDKIIVCSIWRSVWIAWGINSYNSCGYGISIELAGTTQYKDTLK